MKSVLWVLQNSKIEDKLHIARTLTRIFERSTEKGLSCSLEVEKLRAVFNDETDSIIEIMMISGFQLSSTKLVLADLVAAESSIHDLSYFASESTVSIRTIADHLEEGGTLPGIRAPQDHAMEDVCFFQSQNNAPERPLKPWESNHRAFTS